MTGRPEAFVLATSKEFGSQSEEASVEGHVHRKEKLQREVQSKGPVGESKSTTLAKEGGERPVFEVVHEDQEQVGSDGGVLEEDPEKVLEQK
jgi:hypothetical protein